MVKKMVQCIAIVLIPAALALAADGDQEQMAEQQKEQGTKALSGMSIVGNDEAPKSLYIVPWKSSEIGAETSLYMSLNESDAPVDREVFMRQLQFYAVSTGN